MIKLNKTTFSVLNSGIQEARILAALGWDKVSGDYVFMHIYMNNELSHFVEVLTVHRLSSQSLENLP